MQLKYLFDTTTLNTVPDFNKKYLIQTIDEKLMNEYNNEINQQFYLLIGMNELCNDLKLLDSINNGYLFFDEKNVMKLQMILNINMINPLKYL